MKTLFSCVRAFVLIYFCSSTIFSQNCDDFSFFIDPIPGNCNYTLRADILSPITTVDNSDFQVYWVDAHNNVISLYEKSDLNGVTTFPLEIYSDGHYQLYVTDGIEACSEGVAVEGDILVDFNAEFDYTLYSEGCDDFAVSENFPDYYWTFDDENLVVDGDGNVLNSNGKSRSLDTGLGVLVDGDTRSISIVGNIHVEVAAGRFDSGVVGDCIGDHEVGSAQPLFFSTSSDMLMDYNNRDHFAYEFIAKINYENDKTGMRALNHDSYSPEINGAHLLSLFGVDVNEIDYGFTWYREGDGHYANWLHGVEPEQSGLTRLDKAYYFTNTTGNNGWHHYAVTCDIRTSELKLYVDGQLIGRKNSEINSPQPANPSSFPVYYQMRDMCVNYKAGINSGSEQDGHDQGGSFDEFAVYTENKLTPELIYQHYLDAIGDGTENTGGNHYSFMTPDNSLSEIDQTEIDGSHNPLEYPIGYMDLDNSENAISWSDDVDGNGLNDRFFGQLELPFEQMSSFPLPRFSEDLELKRNFPWYEFEYMGGFSFDQDTYIDNADNLMREMVTNWNYSLHMPKKQAAGDDRFAMSHRFADIANEFTDVELTTHFNWRVGYSTISPYGMSNFGNSLVFPENLYPGNSNWSVFGNSLPIWEDGRNQAVRLINENSGFHNLTRPISIINENGERDETLFSYHAAVDDLGEPVENSSWVSALSILEEDGVLPNWSADHTSENWFKDVAINVTNYRNEYFEGIKSSHPFLNDTEKSYYSTDGLGGHRGYDRYKWEDIREVNSSLEFSFNDQGFVNRYATPDFYVVNPELYDGDSDFGHGLLWVENARKKELGIDKFFSPFINPGFNNIATENTRPGQYLGLLKTLGMMGAEYYYGSWFEADHVPHQNPSTYIWNVIAPSYAQGIMSRAQEHFYLGDAAFYDGSLRIQIDNNSIYGTIRKLDDDNSRLIHCTSQRRSNEVTGGQSQELPIPAVFYPYDDSTPSFTVNSELQGCTYILKNHQTEGANPVIYQLDGWHEPWHPSWWKKGFEIEAELYEESNENSDDFDSAKYMTTLVYSEGEGYVPADASTSDFTNFLTYVSSSSTDDLELSYYFTPRSPEASDVHSFNMYVNASKDQNASDPICTVRVIDEEDQNTILSRTICIGDNWNWYKIDQGEDCTEEDNIALTALESKKYRIDVTLTEGAYLDRIYLEAIPNPDSYYLNPESYGSDLVSVDQIEEILYPVFSESFITIDESCTINEILFETELDYCSGEVTISNQSSIINQCDEDEYIWKLEIQDVDGVFSEVAEYSNNTTNFTHFFDLDEIEIYQLTLTHIDSDTPYGPIQFSVHPNPIVELSPGTLDINNGEQVVLTAEVMVNELTLNDFSNYQLDWSPEMFSSQNWIEDPSDLLENQYEVFGINQSSDVINQEYSILVTDGFGCEGTGISIVNIHNCDISIDWRSFNDNNEVQWDELSTQRTLRVGENITSVLNPILNVLEDGLTVSASTSEFIEIDEFGNITISPDPNGEVYGNSNGYGVIEYEISNDLGCTVSDVMYIYYEIKGCKDPEALNENPFATSYSDENFELGTINSASNEIILTPSLCSDSECSINAVFNSEIPNEFISGYRWYDVYEAGNGADAYNIYDADGDGDIDGDDAIVEALNLCQLDPDGYAARLITTYGCTYEIKFDVPTFSNNQFVVSQTSGLTCYNACDAEILLESCYEEVYHVSWEELQGEDWVELTSFEDTDAIENLCLGSYRVTVTIGEANTEQVIFTDEFNVSYTNLHASTEEYFPFCSTLNEGEFTIHPAGGTGVYSYTWTDPLNVTTTSDNANANNLFSGDYAYTVDDGCEILEGLISLDPQLAQGNEVISVGVSRAPCPGLCDGEVEINVLEGFTYFIEELNSGTGIGNGSLCADIEYLVTAEGPQGCLFTYEFSLQTVEILEYSYFDINHPICTNSNDGSIYLGISGGQPPITILINDEESDLLTQNLDHGGYSIEVFDGCSNYLQYIDVALVSQTAPFVVTSEIIQPSFPGASDGQITFEFGGGVEPYGYTFNGEEFLLSSSSMTLTGLPEEIIEFDFFDNCGGEDQFSEELICPCSAQFIDEIISYSNEYTASDGNDVFSNNTMYFNQDLIFEQGFDMTISNAIFIFAEGASLEIKEEADINFNNCTFTACDIWEGIKINTSSINDTEVSFTDGSSIEFAKIGIEADSQGLDLELLNLYAEETSFINNTVGVRLAGLKNVEPVDPWAALPGPYTRTSFLDCSFKVDDSYRASANFRRHAYYARVNGFNFENVSMTNERSTEAWVLRGNGIVSHGSHFDVDQNSFGERSTFSGFKGAIHLGSLKKGGKKTKSFSGVSVISSDFDENLVGIYSLAGRANVFAYNNINLNELIEINGSTNNGLNSDDSEREGIVLAGDYNFKVQNNTITNIGLIADYEDDLPLPVTIGIRVRDNHWPSDMIRNNIYHRLSIGNLANASNRPAQTAYNGADVTEGLRYICNDHFDSEKDVLVSGEPPGFSISVSEIALEQREVEGDLPELEIYSAGNMFSENTNTHFRNSGLEDLNYYWINDVEFPNAIFEPVHSSVNGNSVNIDVVNFIPNTLNECEAPIIGKLKKLALPLQFVEDRIAERNIASENLIGVNYLFNSLIDDGDTDDLKDEVHFTWGSDVWEMRAKLLDISPFVSSKVAYEIADKPEVFPHPIAFEIFAANPDLLKDPKFIRYLLTKSDPMPEYMVNLLNILKDEEGIRTELSKQKSKLLTVKNQAEDDLMIAYNSVGDEVLTLQLMEEKDCSQCDIFLIDYYLENGDIVSAESHLNDLHKKSFVKDPMSHTEVTQYDRWFDLHKDIIQDERSWKQLSSSETVVLEDLAFSYFYTTAGKNAISVLEYISDDSYFIPPYYDETSGISFRSALTESLESEKSKVLVYPNPASHLVNIELDYSQSLKSPSILIIMDSQGKFVHSEDVRYSVQLFTLNTSDWASGTYIYELRGGSEIIKTGKIEVTH